MTELRLYNTLIRKKEEFKPIKTGEVGLYSCGPTVYNYAHIGNHRTYLFVDILKRVLQYNGYKVKHIINITDVGHLTGDQDMGEDKLEKGAKREGVSAWDIAKKYEAAFKSDLEKLNILPPTKYTRATEYIDEQIDLIKTLEEKGFTYVISDGVYFDTSKFPDYNKLSHLKLEDLQEGARVEKNEEKKNPTDFALWKFSPNPPAGGEKRQMEWESPWGIGFPGWHLECSAMSMAELSDKLDIHCGGIDHINVHHTNEIAQSEAATGKKFFNYWMHGAFLNIAGGKKMAKSDGNFLTIENAFLKKNISPLVYRFATLQTHYRKPMEYSEESIKNAGEGFRHLRNRVGELGLKIGEVNQELKNKFLDCVNNDLNMAQALAVVQEVLKTDVDKKDKLATVLDFDKVLGLELDGYMNAGNFSIDDAASSTSADSVILMPKEIEKLKQDRIKAREEKDFTESDRLRDEIEALGYIVEDLSEGMRIIKK